MGRRTNFLKKLRRGPVPKRVPVASLACPACGFRSKVAESIARLGTVRCRCGTQMVTLVVVQPPPSDVPMPKPDPRTKDGYAVYLRSEWWQHRRTTKLKQVGHKCERCDDSANTLHVHHLTYERIGNERDSDLEVLCEACHHREHPGWK